MISKAAFGLGVVMLPMLGKCDLLSRFEQLNMHCESSLIGAFELVLNDQDVGDSVIISRDSGNKSMKIDGAKGDLILIEEGDLAFTINTEDDTVIVRRGSQVMMADCRVEHFKM